MSKKLSLRLTIVCFLSAIAATSGYAMQDSAYTDSSLFDPETSEVSKKTTIRSWLAPQHTPLLETIQRNVAMTVIENAYSVHFMMQIPKAPGNTQYVGRTFRTLPFEVEFLRHIKNISDTKKPVTLEIAAAFGLVSWKVPFCFGEKGGTHYVNDLNFSAMEQGYDSVINQRLRETPTLKEMLVKLPGNCFDIPQTNPHLLGKVDAIYVQNLDHFFNPEDHQRYMRLLADLLAPGGRAFLCAHSFIFKKSDPLYNLYLERKKVGDLYPGFVQYDAEFSASVKHSLEIGLPVLSNATRPADNAPFEKFNIQPPQNAGSIYFPAIGQQVEAIKLHQRVTQNSLSPAIYTRLVAAIPEIFLIDSFFITKERKRASKWDETISHAAVIFEKK
ncbi:MAG: hypothetical protein ACRCYZ_04295 [Alphaproteobacteria bacterium]